MSSPNIQQRREVSVNGGGSSSGNGNGPEEKPRLSENEKKANHIASGMAALPSSYLPSQILCAMTSKSATY